jgi:hypothetical protein
MVNFLMCGLRINYASEKIYVFLRRRNLSQVRAMVETLVVLNMLSRFRDLYYRMSKNENKFFNI